MTSEITNTADVLDSRDVIERCEELAGMDERDGEEEAEYEALKALCEEAAGYSLDWTYGVTLIRDTYFVDYARELAEDLGLIDKNASWPATCIDWERAARELRMDYTSVEFDDVTYWVR